MSSNKNHFKKKQKDTDESSDTIAAQTEAFLSSGHEIQYIQSGVSGLSPITGKKHITISSPNKAKQ
ncbi:hypothetical protein SAMN02745866_00917 [Alteromonadaceae bacterium Bs31]|nr:hypothetical protein SAMN02745866_00917 [Alteromonadaceae bacterium Bs31]